MRDRQLLGLRLLVLASLVLLAGALAASGMASPADSPAADKASPRLTSALAGFQAPSTVLDENFDDVIVPALPVGWTATNASGPAPLWVTSNSGVPTPVADSMPNAAFVDDPAEVSDKRLDSPSISIATATAQLTFRQNRNLESGFDGGVLEISIDGGAFQDILTAGGGFAGGGYDGTISSNFSNPLAGRQAWTGNSSGFVTTTVNLPACRRRP